MPILDPTADRTPVTRSWLRATLGRLVLRPLVRILFSPRLDGAEHLPTRGPALVVANHNSHLDWPVIASLLPEAISGRIRAAGAADYWFASAGMRWASSQVLGVIPLDRQRKGARDEVLRPVREALERGEVVVVFPEGTRGEPEVMQPLKSGIASLAEAFPEVPVHPLFLTGLGRALPKGSRIPRPVACTARAGAPLRWTGSKEGFMEALRARFDELRAASGVGLRHG